ncbi:MAG: DUF4118 domain-containing protein, partial [Gemmataceae bacterium]|nr:DUF4118 domain-containing protein [Gemmataceae bacterium]
MLPPNPRIGYAIAVATTAAVVLLRLVLDRAAGGDVPDFLLPFVLPVILAGWYGGLRCGLLATLLNALAAVYFFTDPAYSWGIAGSGDRVRVGTFVVVGAVVSWLNELLHRYRRRAEDAARTALRRQQELEREVADRRDAERLLTASQGQLRLVTDHAPVLLVHCDTDRRFEFVNRPYAERFGLEPKDVVGKTIPEVLGEAAYDRLRPHVEAALAGRHVEFEVEIPYEKLGRLTMHCVYRPEF